MVRSLHTTEHATLIRLLIDARRENGLTQQAVADRLGKPQSYVAKVESSERRLDMLEFVALADALQIDPAILFKQLLDTLDRHSPSTA